MPRRPPVNPQPATPPIIFDGPRRSKTPLTQVSALQGNAAEFEAAEIVPRVSADDSLDPAACAPEAERFMGTNPNASGLTAAMSASSAALRLGSPAVGEGEALISPTRATILRHEFNWKKIEAMRERAAAKAAEFEEDDAAGENAAELTPPSRDFKALTQFYHATSGAMEWKTRDGWEDEVSNDAASASADDNASVFNVAPGVIATFVGVTACARDPSRVMRLSLPAHALQGKLPSGLGRLDALVELELHSNPRLRGAIPAALGDCAALQLLSLHSNRLTGAIPSELGRCRRLRIVRLQLNRLSGPLPPSLCALPRLRQLQCQSNQLTGPVPEEIGGAASLQVCHLGSNRLSGSLPGSLGKLRALQRLELFMNELTGPVPAELADATALQVIHFGFNRFEGDIPVAELARLGALRKLYLNENRLANPHMQAAELARQLPKCVVSV